MTIPGDSPWSGKTLRLGSRGSRLALAQTEWTARRLEALHPGLRCQIAIVQTTGDKILDSPLALIGGKGVFTKEIEIALLRQEIDLAVHSLKDLPVAQPEGLRLAAVSRREFPGDVLIARQPLDWKSLGPECTVGTSSQRRRAQLALGNPRIHIVDLRGNVPTRIQRVADGELDAIVLARAGIQRLGISGLWMEDLDFDSMLPAPGQGALGFQIRQDDAAAAEIVSALHDEIAWAECAAERTFLAALGGGCQAPIGALGQCDGQRLRLAGLVAALDGRECYRSQTEGPAGQPETIGKQLARLLLEGGAKLLIQRLALSETVEGYENAVSRARTMDAGKPLAGKRVLVTRDEDTDGPLCSALRLYGAEPVVAPLIEESPPANSAPLIECARQADNYDWIVFSSRRAVQAFAEAMRMAGHSFNGIKARIACVGPQTAKTILEAGGRVDRMPDMPGAAGLIEKLRRRNKRFKGFISLRRQCTAGIEGRPTRDRVRVVGAHRL